MRINKSTKLAIVFKNKPEKFLNGLTSNTLNSQKNAFLDRFGKIVVTFEQLKIDDDNFMILIEEQFKIRLRDHLDKYLKLTGVRMEETDKKVYFDLDSDYRLALGEYLLRIGSGKLVVADKNLPDNISENEFRLYRLKNNLPLQGIDYDREMLLNVSEEFASFTKGCYLGQEVIARTKSRSRPPKKLVIGYDDELDDIQKTKITSRAKESAGRELGFIFLDN